MHRLLDGALWEAPKCLSRKWPTEVATHNDLRTERRVDQAIRKIERGADQGTGKNDRFAKHWRRTRKPIIHQTTRTSAKAEAGVWRARTPD